MKFDSTPNFMKWINVKQKCKYLAKGCIYKYREALIDREYSEIFCIVHIEH